MVDPRQIDDDEPDLTPIELIGADGPLVRGSGLGPAVGGLVLAVLSLLSVVAFHFPEYLTTPDLRHSYDVALLRKVLFVGMVVSGGLALFGLTRRRRVSLSVITIGLLAIATLLGGSAVPVGDFPDHTPYLGLDLFILDLLSTALVFIVLEKLFPLRRDQPVFRKGWQLDLGYFFGNDMIVGAVLLAVNAVTRTTLAWVPTGSIQKWVGDLPLVWAVPAAMLVADLSQYWVHRAMHHFKPIWRMHAVHHSTESLDWISGSRLHLGEILLVRTCVILPVLALGFSRSAVDAYVVIVSLQSVFIHSNIRARFGPLRFVVATPNFHHWHHSQDLEGIDKNFAAHFSFLDYIFGTAARSERVWPERYGVLGDYVPQSYRGQMMFPFRRRRGSVRHDHLGESVAR